MHMLKRVEGLIFCIFFIVVISGCAATTSSTALGSGTDEIVYHPKLPEGIATFDDAIQDLARLQTGTNQ